MIILAVKIVTDSTCDIAREKQDEFNITILPLKIKFGSEEFLDGVDMTSDEFFERLAASDELPKTSQITPAEFMIEFENDIKNGDDVVAILLSSDMSGTYQAACLAKEQLGADNIFVVDSRNVTFGLGLLVYEAMKMRDAGKSAKEIYDEIERLKSKVQVLATLGELRYVKMGGRLSSTSAFFASVLGIKPLVEVNVKEGKIKSIGKARGLRSAYEEIKKRTIQLGFDRTRTIAYANAKGEEMMHDLMAVMAGTLSGDPCVFSKVGCVVGTYTGPNCTGLAFFKE